MVLETQGGKPLTPRTITFEVTSDDQESLLRQMHTMLQVLESLTDPAPHGAVLEVCEEAVISKNRELARQTVDYSSASSVSCPPICRLPAHENRY
jgi:hypothetical protein